MQTAGKNQCFIAVCLVLALGTFILYLPVIRNGFVNLDDGVYIYQNRHVASGLNWQNIRWSFSHIYLGYWVPLTWISHMIDCSLFGLHPAGHHLMNVFIHAANAVLLFVLLNYMAGAMRRSAFVAAAFAWHPLRVESVAWACERKDVLSGLFWMLTLLCYARFVRSKTESPQSTVRSPPSRWAFYALGLFFFACGLMSKPMVVTLPFVLLLLDFWPLQRFSESGAATASTLQRVILEKIPFFALSLAESVATYRDCGASASIATEPFSFRLIHSFWGYLQYISKTFVPLKLAVLYPFPAREPFVIGLVGVVLVLGFTILFVAVSRSRPYLLIGWLWFLGTLVPVIGFVQSGYQSMADRFTYLPCIGFFVVIAWGLADLVRSPQGKPILAVTEVAALVACVVLTSIQIRYWRDSITLFRHALAVTTNNYVACACLGQALDAAGDEEDALVYCNEAVRLDSEYPDAQFFLGQALWKTGGLSGALTHLSTAAELELNNAGYQYNLGNFLLEQGKTDDAISHFTAALKAQSDFAEAHNAMGKARLKQGKLDAAADELAQAVMLEPNNAQFHYDLGTVFLNSSQTARAITEFIEATRLQPDFALACENLAVAEAGQGKMADAIEHFARTVQLEPNDPAARFNLGFAYLNDHQPALAAEQFSAESRLTPNETKAHYRLAQALREQNELPQAVKEYRQTLRLAPDFTAAKQELDEILAAHPKPGDSSK
ncbi:MAG TPA: tetratricopeptide repeat protein [Candidatus Acidoferrales bacterium]|jgi:tetratricopeptide (TPR) repeat protein|nr:tetratricopeptide repeat protein [Candidatus Acidoferrales bacterium]